MSNNDSQESIRVATELGGLAARIKSVEDRVIQDSNAGHNIISELRDELRNNTEKFEKIMESLSKLIHDHREDVSRKIENAKKEVEEKNEEKFVTRLQFSSIEAQLNGLTSKLTMIWSAIIFFGYAINWLIAHPGIISALGAK